MEDVMEFSQEVIDFILKNEDADPYVLALKKSPFPDVEMKVIVWQIRGRKVARRKFPFLLAYDQFQYPKKESLEQASSEKTALYKSKLISGSSFVDLTGGMGIDTYLLGKKFRSSAYVEPNPDLYKTTTHNFVQLKFLHCQTYNQTCEGFLSENDKKFDWVYLDPSRRIGGNRKTSIHNYEPNLIALQDDILKHADNVMVKLSPMQDISECINALKKVSKIWVISIQNEVKELLIHIKKDSVSPPTISAIDLNKNGETEFAHLFSDRICNVNFGKIKSYLYQPGAAIVKSELQNRYAFQLGLEKLHANTQLYTSNQLIEDFIGRVFLVKERIHLNKKELKKALPHLKANVIAKNFPLSAQEIVRKYKLEQGGKDYLMAFTDFEESKEVCICERIS